MARGGGFQGAAPAGEMFGARLGLRGAGATRPLLRPRIVPAQVPRHAFRCSAVAQSRSRGLDGAYSDPNRHVIGALVVNDPGVLAGVATLFAARGFNIDSLVVGRTEVPELSRMTIVVQADQPQLDNVRPPSAARRPSPQDARRRSPACVVRARSRSSSRTSPRWSWWRSPRRRRALCSGT